MGPLKSPARVAAEPGSNAEPGSTPRLGMADVRPRWSLWLLSIAHAVNHAQAVVLPLIYLKITDDFHVGVDTIAFLAAGGAFAAGVVQLSFASLTRLVSRRRLLGAGGLLFGGGFVAQAFASGFPTFASSTSCRGSAARRSIRSATASSQSSSRPSGGASRSARTSPAEMSGRSSGRQSGR